MIHHINHIALLCLVLFTSQFTFAYDFEVNGIYYHITSLQESTVEVTYQNNSQTATSSYSGVISIPEFVSYNNKTYSVTAIGDWAFCRCSSLTDVQLPGSIERIGSYAFFNCSQLNPFPIPEKVSFIGNRAFYGNSNFSTSSNIRYVGDYLVSAIDKKQNEYSIQDGTKWIGAMAFSGCSTMTRIKIPASIVCIGNHAFQGCTNLSAVNIPTNVQEIGYFAFEGCNNLKDIFAHWTTPPTIENGVFNGVNKEECILHVPFGSKAQFQEAIEWGSFIIIESCLGDVNEDGTIDEIDIKTIATRILNKPIPEIFNEKAADINQDGIISISDIAKTITLGTSSE